MSTKSQTGDYNLYRPTSQLGTGPTYVIPYTNVFGNPSTYAFGPPATYSLTSPFYYLDTRSSLTAEIERLQARVTELENKLQEAEETIDLMSYVKSISTPVPVSQFYYDNPDLVTSSFDVDLAELKKAIDQLNEMHQSVAKHNDPSFPDDDDDYSMDGCQCDQGTELQLDLNLDDWIRAVKEEEKRQEQATKTPEQVANEAYERSMRGFR